MTPSPPTPARSSRSSGQSSRSIASPRRPRRTRPSTSAGYPARRLRPRSTARSSRRSSGFQLVLRINVIAQEVFDREALIQSVLSAYLGLALTAVESPQEPAMVSVPTIRDLLFVRVAELHALQTAREQVEARYLQSAQALFPAGLRAWDGQRHASEREAVIADRLAELDGCEPAPPDDPGATDARVAQLVADHVDPARSNAYDQVGDGRRALSVAVRWLRPKLLGDDPQITRS
jgi:hypothetical protein